MAFRYKRIKNLDETYPNEEICAVYDTALKNRTGIASDEHIINAQNEDDCKLVVWRSDEDPYYYRGIDKDGRIKDMEAGIVTEHLGFDEETIDTIKEVAKGLVAFCVRNNTALEDYHAQQVPITDERMKQFMKDCVNNVYFVLTGLCAHNDPKLSKDMMNFLGHQASLYTRECDEPETTKWYKYMKDLLD